MQAGRAGDRRLAIVNGFGRTLGDGIIGLEALAAVRARGLLAGGAVLFRLVTGNPVIADLYRLAGALAEVRELPWAEAAPVRPFAGAAAFARVLDIRDFAFDPAFRGVAMIDYFLGRLGADPAAVPGAWRRNRWLAAQLPPPPVRRAGVLLCARTANVLRDMPHAVQAMIGDWCARHGIPLVDQAALPRAASLGELAALVAGARLVVSADTAMVHLADAAAAPCLAFFTTHRPEWRVRDYPLCRAVVVPVGGLPPALEFSRGEADERAVAAGWALLGRAAVELALDEAWRASGE